MAYERNNLNPHKPAVMAMCLFNKHYADQNGRSMDFWDSLSERERNICRELVQRIAEAPSEG